MDCDINGVWKKVHERLCKRNRGPSSSGLKYCKEEADSVDRELSGEEWRVEDVGIVAEESTGTYGSNRLRGITWLLVRPQR